MAVRDFYWSQVVLAAHLVATNGASTTPDASQQANVLTLRNGASIVADSDFIGGNVLSVGGSAAVADTPYTNALFGFGTSDFTVEGAIKTTDTTGGVIDTFVSGSTTSWQVYLETGKLAWYAGSTRKLISTTSVNTGAKFDFAVTRTGGTIRLFINGVLEASLADTTNYASTATVLSIGRQVSGSPSATSDIIGKIGEVRITRGVARYTATYSVDTAAFPTIGYVTPTAWSTTDKGSGVTLSSGNLAANTNASSAVRSAYGATAGKFYFEVQATTGVLGLLGAGRPAAPISGTNVYPGSEPNGWAMYWSDGQKYNAGVNTAYNGAGIALNVVVGVKLDLDNGTIGFVVNGVDKGVAFSNLSGTVHAMFGWGSSGTFGTMLANFGGSPFSFAVPAGYTPGFGVPTATISGNVKDASNANAARKVFLLREDTGALQGSATSDGTTGNFSIPTPYSGTHTVVAEPAAGENLNALVFKGVTAL